MIIELYGLSGSGKSFSTPLIAARFDLPIADVGRRPERYARFLSFCRRHPRLVTSLLLETFVKTGFKPLLLLHKLKMLVASLAKVEKARQLGGGIVDAGVFQFLLVIYEEGVTMGELMRFRNMLALDDYRVLIFDVEQDVRRERIRTRGGAPRAQFGSEYQRRWYETYLKNDKVVQDFLTAHFEFMRYQN